MQYSNCRQKINKKKERQTKWKSSKRYARLKKKLKKEQETWQTAGLSERKTAIGLNGGKRIIQDS
jgi:hypothetical protein